MPGKRYSRQRELIYQAVLGSREHPTAEMVYQWLKPANPNLSLGTVYRNLNLLAEEGLLIRMPFLADRYDGDTHPHTHFLCESCGRLLDMELEYDVELDVAAAASEPGLRIHGHSLTFRGLCPQCAEKEL